MAVIVDNVPYVSTTEKIIRIRRTTRGRFGKTTPLRIYRIDIRILRFASSRSRCRLVLFHKESIILYSKSTPFSPDPSSIPGIPDFPMSGAKTLEEIAEHEYWDERYRKAVEKEGELRPYEWFHRGWEELQGLLRGVLPPPPSDGEGQGGKGVGKGGGDGDDVRELGEGGGLGEKTMVMLNELLRQEVEFGAKGSLKEKLENETKTESTQELKKLEEVKGVGDDATGGADEEPIENKKQGVKQGGIENVREETKASHSNDAGITERDKRPDDPLDLVPRETSPNKTVTILHLGCGTSVRGFSIFVTFTDFFFRFCFHIDILIYRYRDRWVKSERGG